MLVITRYTVEADDRPAFLTSAEAVLAVLAKCAGCLHGWVGRATDDPGLWLVTTEWENVGAYRRALSQYQVRVEVIPLLSRAIDEPTAFEVLSASDSAGVSEAGTALAADAGTVGLGGAAEAEVPTDVR